MRIGPGPHLKGRELLGGVIRSEEFDYFHEMILHQELSNPGTRGYNDGLLGGGIIGLPALVNYGSESLKAKYLPDILDGKKVGLLFRFFFGRGERLIEGIFGCG